MKKIKHSLESFFKIKERSTSISKEIISGIIVFLAMLYILPVNTLLLQQTGMSGGAVFAATAIASAVATLIMGLIANYPIMLSTGMGLNAFLTYTVCDQLGYSWQEGLALVLVSGVLFFVITMSGLRVRLVNSIPKNIKIAISSGIGFYIAFIGFKSTGIITSDEDTFVALGNLLNPTILLGLFGIVLVFVLMSIKKTKSLAIVIAMLMTALLGYVLHLLGVNGMPHFQASSNNISDIQHSFGISFQYLGAVLVRPESYAVIFSLVFVNLFDTTATLVAVGKETGIIDQDGQLIDGKKAMLADATGAVLGGILGTSLITPFAESTIGVENGARTGLSSTVTGILFLLSLLVYPVFSIFFQVGDHFTPVTSMALVLVGAMMFANIKDIDWKDQIATFSSFLIILLMVLTYSISDGLGIGIVIYVLMMLVSKRGKEVSPLIYGVAIFFILNFILYFAVLA